MQLYHCHSTPLKKHIAKGLYGAFIIDPPKPRPPAQELVMVLNGFDTDGDGENNFYAVNGPAFYYAKYPIRVRRSQTVRIYLANLTEFDLINSFHLHGDFFRYYPTGSSDHFEYTDTVMLCQGQRGIIEIDFAQHRPVHVPRPPVGVHRARLDGLLRRDRLMDGPPRPPRSGVPATWRLWALVPLLLLAGVVALFASTGTSLLDLVGRAPPPRDQFDVRRVEFKPGEISIRVTNPQRAEAHDRERHRRRRDRPVHRRRPDRARPAALEHDRRSLPVGRGDPYTVGVTSSSGIQTTFDVPAAVETRGRDRAAASSATRSSGFLVGVIPVALGLGWLPSLRRAERRVGRRVHGAHRRAARASSPSTHLPRRSTSRRRFRAGSRGPA